MTATLPLEPHLLAPEAYSENYIAVFELESGGHMQIQLALTNIGVGDQHSMCRVLYLGEEKSWNEQQVYSQEQWDFTPSGKLTFGSCEIIAEEKSTSIIAKVNGVRVNAILPAPLSPSQGPGHRIDAGTEFFDLDILLPWSPVEMQFSAPDQPEQFLRGHGCIYHFWVTAWPNDLARKWIRIFGLWKNGAFLVMSHFPPGESAGKGAVWSPDSRAPLALKFIDIKIDEKDGGMVRSRDGKEYRLTVQKQLFRHAPLEDLGLLGHIIQLFMGNWVTRTYRGHVEMPGEQGWLPVVIEITVDE